MQNLVNDCTQRVGFVTVAMFIWQWVSDLLLVCGSVEDESCTTW